MDRVLDLVTVLIFDNLGGNEQQSEPGNADGVGYYAFEALGIYLRALAGFFRQGT